MKRIARLLLFLAVALEIGWIATTLAKGAAGWLALSYPLVITSLLLCLVLSNGRAQRLNALSRIVLGLVFLLSVSDRFGLLGRHGRPGVSWGDYAHFVSYTRVVNSFLPASWAPGLAATATICETVLGVALMLGVFTRIAELGAVALLTIFAAAMTASLGFQSQFPYAVLLLASGALFLSCKISTSWSVDNIRSKLREAPPTT